MKAVSRFPLTALVAWLSLFGHITECAAGLAAPCYGESEECGGAFPYAYITNYGSNSVSVIDTTGNGVVATIPVGTGPYGVAVSADGSRVYVANYVSSNVSVIDGYSHTVIATVPVTTRPYGLAVSPNGRWVYVAAFFSNTVAVIDTASNTVIANIPVGQRPRGVVVSNDNQRVYVANYATNNVSVIDVATNTVVATIALPAGSNPTGITLRPDTTRLYVTGYSNKTLYHIDTATNTIVATTPVGNRPWGVAVSPDQSTVYVANYNGNAVTVTGVSVIDVATNTARLIPLPLGAAPAGITVDPSGWPVYTASYSEGKVYVIDDYANTVIDTIGVGLRPYAFGAFMAAPPVSSWDVTPPTVTNLSPAYGAIHAAGTVPPIAAEYSNPATGIDTGSVVLLVDGVDVTAQTQVSATGVSYTPGSLSEGYHHVELTVADRFGLPTYMFWDFYVTAGPRISSLTPADGTVLPPGPLPEIHADYLDGAYVDLNSIRLLVDGQDVTAQSRYNYNSIWYTPTRLAAGPHTVTLSVGNPIGLTAVANWAFSTTSGIQVTPLTPQQGQRVTDPRASVSASFSDSVSTIDVGRTQLSIDGTYVSTLAQVVGSGINFVPRADWSVGSHTASLTVHDFQGTSANATWTFSYDPAPTIYDETPRDVYIAVPNPTVYAFLKDNGTGVNVAATTVSLDGTDMTAQASISASNIALPTAGLAPGVHTVAVHTVSNTGQPADKQWQFTVIALPPPATTADGVRTGRTFNPTLPANQ